MIDRYGTDGATAAIDGTVPTGRADLVVSTAHRSKGLEWQRVRIADDYHEPLDKQTRRPLPVPNADAMLAYVSVTRAMDRLDTGGLGWVHARLAALEAPTVQTAPIAAAGLEGGVQAAEETPPVRASAPSAVNVGDEVPVAGEHGTFKIKGLSRDGSYEAYATNGSGEPGPSARSGVSSPGKSHPVHSRVVCRWDRSPDLPAKHGRSGKPVTALGSARSSRSARRRPAGACEPPRVS